MRAFWAEHSSKPSVESMMLDSQAAEIDSEERPEVRKREGIGCRRPPRSLSSGVGRAYVCASIDGSGPALPYPQ